MTRFSRKTVVALAGVLAGAGGVLAAGPDMGCYARTYMPDHLRAHPDQVVRVISLNFFKVDGQIYADMEVIPANQGHVRGTALADVQFTQYLVCNTLGKQMACDVPAQKGGSLVLLRANGDEVLFATRNLFVEARALGGPEGMNLAERKGQETRYLLYRAPAVKCEM